MEGALDQKGTARMVQIQWPIARPCIIAESNHCLRLYVRSIIIGQSMREKDCWLVQAQRTSWGHIGGTTPWQLVWPQKVQAHLHLAGRKEESRALDVTDCWIHPAPVSSETLTAASRRQMCVPPFLVSKNTGVRAS